MTRGRQLSTLALLAVTAACAALVPERPPELNAEARLDRGLAAVEAGAYSEAFDDLSWVYTQCYGRTAGVHALAGLAAIELDPRNPRARPQLGTELLGRLIRGPGTPAHVRPLVETSFLTALALGAPRPAAEEEVGSAAGAMPGEAEAPLGDAHEHSGETPALEPPARPSEQIYGCGRAVDEEGWVPPALPTLPGPSMAVLLANLESERDSIAVHADTLATQLTVVREQLQATREELERIRETLKP